MTHNDEPDINVVFMDHISSLILQTMVGLGRVEHPVSKRLERNLKQANIMIDTLIAIKDKTKGNLTDTESEFLEQSLLQLKVEYDKEVPGTDRS
jgi:hypothetical protein